MILAVLLPNRLALYRYTGRGASRLHLAPAPTPTGHGTRALCGTPFGNRDREFRATLKPSWHLYYRDDDQNNPAPLCDLCPRCFTRVAPSISDLHTRFSLSD